MLLGCEGSEHTIAYLAKRVGIQCFAYASDYPHEVDLPAAVHEIDEVAERNDLAAEEKRRSWRATPGDFSSSKSAKRIWLADQMKAAERG
jgi:hypothetical protein